MLIASRAFTLLFVVSLFGCASYPDQYAPPAQQIEKRFEFAEFGRSDQTLWIDFRDIRAISKAMRTDSYGEVLNLSTGAQVAIGIGAAIAVVLFIDTLVDEGVGAGFPPGT